MGKIVLLLCFFVCQINLKSQIVELDKRDLYCLKKIDEKSEYFLNIKAKGRNYNYRIKKLNNKPDLKQNKEYSFIELMNMPKSKGKVFKQFDALRYGAGYFFTNGIYYKNLGTPID